MGGTQVPYSGSQLQWSLTDDFDRRLLHSYINTTFCPDAIATSFYKYV